jgi:hypothetical protein
MSLAQWSLPPPQVRYFPGDKAIQEGHTLVQTANQREGSLGGRPCPLCSLTNSSHSSVISSPGRQVSSALVCFHFVCGNVFGPLQASVPSLPTVEPAGGRVQPDTFRSSHYSACAISFVTCHCYSLLWGKEVLSFCTSFVISQALPDSLPHSDSCRCLPGSTKVPSPSVPIL